MRNNDFATAGFLALTPASFVLLCYGLLAIPDLVGACDDMQNEPLYLIRFSLLAEVGPELWCPYDRGAG